LLFTENETNTQSLAGVRSRTLYVKDGVVKLARPFSQLRLPSRVQGILAARIDRQPGEHKQLLQTLAVIGRESRLDLIREIVPTPEGQLHEMLAELQASEFIYEHPAFPQAEFVFKQRTDPGSCLQLDAAGTAQGFARMCGTSHRVHIFRSAIRSCQRAGASLHQ
jgi:hypothetical protein